MQIQTNTKAPAVIPAPAFAPGSGVLSRLSHALTIRRERRALLALDDRMLADVGLSRADAYREAHRSLLDVPASLAHLSAR